MADYLVSSWAGHTLYICNHGDDYATLDLAVMQQHLSEVHGVGKPASVGGITSDLLSPTTEVAALEYPVSHPNPQLDGGRFERFGATPVVPLPPDGVVVTVDTSTGVNTTTDVLTYSGTSNPGDKQAVKFTTTGTLPAPLVTGQVYYINNINTVNKTFQLRANPSDAAVIDITTTGTGIITVTEYVFDRLLPDFLVADPARNRVLMMVHGRKPQVGEIDYSGGRDMYLMRADWDADLHNPASWSWLTPTSTPAIPRGSAGQYDALSTLLGAGKVIGNTLYVAYGYYRSFGHVSVGLASINLVTLAVTKITTAALPLGTTPYQAVPNGLDYRNGEFVLYVNVMDGTNNLCPVPRIYRNPAFVSTGWACDEILMEYGGNDTNGSDTGMPTGVIMRDGTLFGGKNQGTWIGGVLQKIWFTIHAHTIKEQKVVSRDVAIGLNPSASGFDSVMTDNMVVFWHQGDWYAFWCGNNQATAAPAIGAQIGGGKYTVGTQEDQTGFTVASTTYQRTKMINNVTSSATLATGFADFDFSAVFKKLDYVSQSSVCGGGVLITIVALNTDVNSATVNGKMQVKMYYPTAAIASTPSAAQVAAAAAAGITKTPSFNITGKPI